jgi:hypothetical protein
VDVYSTNQPIAGDHNLIGNANGLGGSGISDGDANGNIVGHASQLGLLANNGGPTQTMAPQAGSPVIQKGGPIGALQGDTGPSDTLIGVTVPSAVGSSGLPGAVLEIGGEQMLVTDIDLSTNTLTVERGYNGTPALGHHFKDRADLAYDQAGNARDPLFSDIGAIQTQPDHAPAIVSGTTASFVVGKPGKFLVWAVARPAATLSEDVSDVLPSGVTFDAGTGLLQGIPDVGANGSYTLHFTAHNGIGSDAGQTLTLTVNGPPVITTQPISRTVKPNTKVTFTAEVDSTTPAFFTLWQVSIDGGTTFTTIPGSTSTSLTVTATAARDGEQFRALFVNGYGSQPTTPAVLSVTTAPVITLQPATQTVAAGATVTLRAMAVGSPEAAVQWQSKSPGKAFADIPGATATTLSFTALPADNGRQLKAVFTNAKGKATTRAATLTVGKAPAVTTQPADPGPLTSKQKLTLSAAASGFPVPKVQWQVSADGGATFADVKGATRASLNLVASATLDGNEYRAVFTSVLGRAVSQAVTLSGTFPPVVTGQPAKVTVSVGDPAPFTASAAADPFAAVQWQVSAHGGSFVDILGAAATTYTLPVAAAADTGNRYRTVFTNAQGTATTASATLTVVALPVITQQPADQVGPTNTPITFTARAGGQGVGVQWQRSTNGGKTWSDLFGATSTSLTVNLPNTQSGWLYHAVFTNGSGKVTTRAAALTVGYAPLVEFQPHGFAVQVGQSVSLSASASSDPAATVQWQVSTDGGQTFTNIKKATAGTLKVKGKAGASGYLYRAVFANLLGAVITDAVGVVVW